MNDKIKELWSQAGGHYNTGNQHTWPEYTIDDPKKFVELLIREAAHLIETRDPRVEPAPHIYLMKAFNEYLGRHTE